MAKIVGKTIFRNYAKKEEAMMETQNNCSENKLREIGGMKTQEDKSVKMKEVVNKG